MTHAGLTRFAPAPTGHLHLGHVVNALFVWGLAGLDGAAVLLRIEDHDAQRCRPEYERAILDDLDWLGFAPDLFPTRAFRAGVCGSRQRDRQDVYTRHAHALTERGLVYACTCARQAAADRRAPLAQGCPGGCAARALPVTDNVAWRLKLPSEVIAFEDRLCGPQTQSLPSGSGDVAIRDRLNNWTYQFAVSVDDAEQGVTLVIRGRDLLESTATQIQIAAQCGRKTPARFAHHPLVMKTPTQKLSKSSRDTSVGDLRRAGWPAARVIGEAAHRIGLAPAGAQLRGDDAARLLGASWSNVWPGSGT